MKKLWRLTALLLAALILFTSCMGQDTKEEEDPGPAPNPVYTLPESLKDMTLRAEREDACGIETDSAFVIDAPGKPGEAELLEALTIEPEVPFTLSMEGGIRLLPEAPLQPNTVYTVTARSAEGEPVLSWAFQTKRRFQVLGTTPYGGAGGVARDTGIEINFNYEDVDISGYFKISPKVEGDFLTEGTRSAFVPARRLDYSTTYTVTLLAGLPGPDGNALEEDHVFTFTTESPDYYSKEVSKLEFFLNGEHQETFLADDAPLLEISGYNIGENQQFDLEVFGLSGEEYVRELLAFNRRHYDPDYESGRESYRMDTENLEPLLTFSTRPTLVVSNYNAAYYPKYLILPDPLPPGYYLIAASTTDPQDGERITRQKLVQVNDLSVYIQSVNGDGLAWVNDTVAGGALEGAAVELSAPLDRKLVDTATTGQDGVARFAAGQENLLLVEVTPPVQWPAYQARYNQIVSGEIPPPAPATEYEEVPGEAADPEDGEEMPAETPVEENLPLIPITPEQPPVFYDLARLSPQSEPTARETYTSFVYTDREIYQPTDEIQFWGILRGRREALPAGTSLQVLLYKGYYYSYYGDYYGYYDGDSDTSLLSTWVTLEEDGTYIGSLPIELLVSDYYYIAVVDEQGRRVDSAGFRISRYEKPVYKTSLYTDKLFYLPGEQVDLNTQVTFYEGTPAWGKSFAYSGEMMEEDVTVTLDETGVGRALITPRVYGSGWAPQSRYYYARDLDSGSALSNLYGNYLYFPSELIMQVEQKDRVITATLNALDTSGIGEYGDIYADYPNNFLGEAVDAEIQVEITRTTHVREPQASYYDWTRKKTVTRYSYRTETETHANYTATTQGGRLVLDNLPAARKDTIYHVTLSCTDSRDYTVAQTVYLYSGTTYPYFSYVTNIRNYSFQMLGEDPDSRYWYYVHQYALGETIEFALVCDSTYEEPEGQVLYTAYQDRLVDVRVSDPDKLSLEQAARHIPNITIQGAYFDGRYVYPVSSVSAQYDPADEELSIRIEADQERYRPGEAVSLQVSVTDKDGSPAPGRVSISVVDEAVFALREQELNPVSSLYRSAYYRSAVSYQSYVQHLFYVEDTGGKGGGGDGDPYRDDFPDTAQFLSIETDEQGVARVEFELPDNITSWRVTTVAVAKDALRAGTHTSNINASLPLFIQAVYTDTYLSGDEVAVNVSCHGTAVGGVSTPVRYYGELTPGEGTGADPVEVEIKSRTNRQTTLNFGSLPAGFYQLSVRAETNDDTDGVRYDIQVVESAIEVPVVQELILTNGSYELPVSPSRYPVLVGFADSQYATYFRVARHQLWGSTARADRRVAAIAAKYSMLQYVEEEDAYCLDYISEDLSRYITSAYEGGLRLYPYDSGDPVLTAKALVLLGSDHEQSASLKEAVLRAYNNDDKPYTPKQEAVLLMAMASIRQPVLNEVRARLEVSMIRQDPDTVLYLCTALALLGDTEGARQVYEETIVPNLSATGGTLQYYDKSGTTDQNYETTAAALCAAAAMGHEDAEPLALQILGTSRSFHYDPWMELGIYLREFRPTHQGSSTVQYMKNGKMQTLDLRLGGVSYVSLMAADLGPGNVRVTKGEVAATVFYTGNAVEYHRSLQEEGQGDALDREASAAGQVEEDIEADEATAPDNGSLGISRTIKKATKAEIIAHTGNELWPEETMAGMYLVEIAVELSATAPEGIYEISDRIPTPLRFDSLQHHQEEGTRMGYSLWYTREQQDLRLNLYHYKKSPLDIDPYGEMTPGERNLMYDALADEDRITITYLTRLVSGSAFVAEDVFVTHPDTGLTAWGNSHVDLPDLVGDGKRSF